MTTEVCEDHHICRNGSICVPHPTFPGSYTCECVKDEHVYAGLSCDHMATSYCNPDNSVSAQSFCTNNGICLDDMNEFGEHAGCECPAEYKGKHCEYTIGQSVPDPFQSTEQRSSVSSGDNNKALVATFSALAAFAAAAVLVAAFVAMKRRRNGAVHSTMSPKSIRQADSTQLDADGQVLRSSMHAMSGEFLSSSPASNGSSSTISSSRAKPSRDTEADLTEGVESGGSAYDEV